MFTKYYNICFAQWELLLDFYDDPSCSILLTCVESLYESTMTDVNHNMYLSVSFFSSCQSDWLLFLTYGLIWLVSGNWWKPLSKLFNFQLHPFTAFYIHICLATFWLRYTVGNSKNFFLFKSVLGFPIRLTVLSLQLKSLLICI